MSLRTAIHACLKADADCAALLGADAQFRHYPLRAPQGVMLPCVASQEIASAAQDTHGVPGDAEDTMDETLIQFSCYAETLAAALAVRAAVRAALMDDAGGILAAAHIVVTGPDTREFQEDGIDIACAQLDLTFFHNPQT